MSGSTGTWGSNFPLKRKQDDPHGANAPPKRPRVGEVRATGGYGGDSAMGGGGQRSGGNGARPGGGARGHTSGGTWGIGGAPPSTFPVATAPGAGAPYNYNMPGSANLGPGAASVLDGTPHASAPDMNSSGGEPSHDIQSEEPITLGIHPMPLRSGSVIYQQYTHMFLHFPASGRMVTGAINRNTPIVVTPQGLVTKFNTRRVNGGTHTPQTLLELQKHLNDYSAEFNYGGVNLTQSTGAITLLVGGPGMTYHFWPDADPLEVIGFALLYARAPDKWAPDYGMVGTAALPGAFGPTGTTGGMPFNGLLVGAPDVLADHQFDETSYNAAGEPGTRYRSTFKWVMAAVTVSQYIRYVRNNKKIPSQFYHVGLMLEHPSSMKAANGPTGPTVFQTDRMSWPEQNHSVLCRILRQTKGNN
jgi:hypothetical protein